MRKCQRVSELYWHFQVYLACIVGMFTMAYVVTAVVFVRAHTVRTNLTVSCTLFVLPDKD